MNTKVINIDGFGIVGIETLIWRNPDWKLITCGQTRVHDWNGVTNFAVFEKTDPSGAVFFEPCISP